MSRLASVLLLALAVCTACLSATASAAGQRPAAGLHRDGEIFARIGRLLEGAHRRVWVEMYELGRRDLEARLVHLRAGGIDVRVITDPSVDVSSAAASTLRAGGVPVRLYPIDDSVHQIDHVKLLIVDGAALVGGMNWGLTSWRNHDYALDVGAGADVARLVSIFEQDWALSGGRPRPLPADGAGPLYQTAPGDEIRERLLALIRGARRSISAEVFVLSDPDVVAALGLAHLRGVRVRVLLDPNQDSNAASCASLRLAGVDVAWYPVAPGQKLHAKAGLFDGALLLGSANWSVGGLSTNHELDVETREPAQAAAFGAWFEADWSRARPWWKWWLGLAC